MLKEWDELYDQAEMILKTYGCVNAVVCRNMAGMINRWRCVYVDLPLSGNRDELNKLHEIANYRKDKYLNVDGKKIVRGYFMMEKI